MTNETVNETVTALRTGLCNLVYDKINGERRTGVGTLNLDLIPVEFHPKHKTALHEQVNEPNELIHYFDTQSNGWRCFWSDNLKSLSLV
jgi:WYL_2, Sm-like SH3 beta-barrel fold